MRVALRALCAVLFASSVVPVMSAQSTVTFTGRVTDSLTGLPLAGAHVRIDRGGVPAIVLSTEADGTFAAAGFAAGDYLISAYQPHYVSEYFDNLECRYSCVPVSVNVPAGVFTADFALEPFARFGGTVVDAATNRPIAGATVRLYGPVGLSATTATDGSYDVDASPGAYTLTVSASGYATELYADIPCVAADCLVTAGAPIPVSAGSTARIDVALSPGGRLAGTVRRAGTGAAVPYLTVELFNAATSRVAVVTSGADGGYAFPGLATGGYYVRTIGDFPPKGVVPRVYGGDECQTSTTIATCRVASGQLVPVVAGATTALDLLLGGTATLSGTVTLSGGGGLAGIRVEAYAGGLLQGSASSDAAGAYQLTGLRPGGVQVRTNTSSYPDEWRGGQYVAAGPPPPAATVVVASDAVTTGVDFELAPGGAISGTLTHGLSILGFGGLTLQVSAYSAAGQLVRTVSFLNALAPGTTPLSYTLDGLPPGTYYVRTFDPAVTSFTSPYFFTGGDLVEEIYGFGPCVTVDCDVTRGAPIRVSAGAVTSGIDFALKTGGRLNGAVAGAQVYDARGVLVDSRRYNPGTVRIAPSPSIVGLPPGTYYVRLPSGRLYRDLVCLDCAATSGTPILLRSGEAMPLPLPDVGDATLSGVVRREATGDPLSTITVVATTRSGSLVTTAVTDLFGEYALADLSPGTYYLRTRNDRGFVDELYGGLACADCAPEKGTPVTVADGAQLTGIDFALAEGTTVVGTVTDGGGVAVAGARVGVFDAAGELRIRARTDTLGRYRATLPAGTYYARFEPTDGYAMQVYDGRGCATTAGCLPTAGTPIVVATANPPAIDFHVSACSGAAWSPRLLAHGAVGDPYRQRFAASGGATPYRFLLVEGILPPGLTLGAADGILAGTPEAGGTYAITVAAVDATGCPDVRDYSLHIAACSFVVSPSSLTAPVEGGRFAITMTDACGDRTVRSPATWVQPDPLSTGNPVLNVAANGDAAPRSVVVTVGRRTLVVQQAGLTSPPPFGSLDIPADGAVVEGSMAMGGWALDDLDVRRVAIYRDPVAGENGLIYLGEATFVPGARPDVAAAYPALPGRERAGWGYLVLTNMLPNQGNGAFRFHAIAEDAEGRQTLLGTRLVNVANAGATAPFGAIDTPAQGATISGTAYVNFGWALTPQPKSIPFDGATITVVIDGKSAGHPSFNFYRSDVSTLFPGLVNTPGPVGFFTIDTTALEEGLHTIAWVVTDDSGAASGIGSRYFVVDNSTVAPPAVASAFGSGTASGTGSRFGPGIEAAVRPTFSTGATSRAIPAAVWHRLAFLAPEFSCGTTPTMRQPLPAARSSSCGPAEPVRGSGFASR